ncbi:phosphate transport system substrate-binding protein [Anaerosolibacter carboniphilus]|uniref:Phosphate transport system substrate-binding protein n=1 Tax=Anaerosolibacter carboniphilus TaxID=1417629 RepID=A0A841KV47_9FIRM|nr:substrate-binding domain-containing protein [Anaerosolibacter carboniphilus]MBB6214055.1 phosphate transport system substrate-binding protein [Anaerosolibacter carboniphilus]
MKSNKNYIISTLAAQMIMIPILLTLGLIGLGQVLRISGLGKDAASLMYILLAFLGSFIVGGVVGYIFSKQSKEKTDAAKVRYLTPLFPIVYALIFAVLAVALSNGNYNSQWWGIYAFKNPFFIIFDFILAFIGLHYIMPVAEISGYLGFVVGLLLNERIARTSIKDEMARNLKISFAALSVVVVIFIGISNKDIIRDGITELQYGESTVGNDLTEFDLMEIAPFKKNNGLARLDGKASLQFEKLDEMPRLDGATAAYPVYGAFVEAVYKGLDDYYKNNMDNYEKDVYEAFVSSQQYPFNIVQCSKTTGAYERLINGESDIIFVAEPSKAQVEMIKDKGDAFVLTPIGSEAFVFFTNVKNPVENLTIQEIQDIYAGKIINWKEVGGKSKTILPYQRPENSGSQTIMENKVMKDVKMLAPTKKTYAGGMGEIISEVSSYKNAKNAIGYSFMYYSSTMIKNNQIKYISIDGVKPTTETVRSKEYPFTVPVYAVTLKSNTNENVGKLMDWILSDEGQSLVEKTGYVPAK